MKQQQIESIMTGLGFSLNESRAYTALVGENPLTGYELSGRSGIPRSKIYECIERLKRKGLVLPVVGNPVRYVPVPPEEFVRRLSGEFESSVRTLEALLKEQTHIEDMDYIFNIRGYQEIISKAAEMIRGTQTALDLSLWDEEADGLRDECEAAAKRGVTIRMIAFGETMMEMVDIYRHRPLTSGEFKGRWITVVKDRHEVLTGECKVDNGSIAAWTRNRSLVFMSMKYIEHEIIRIQEAGHDKTPTS